MRHPRTPRHFPHMKVRGARRRRRAYWDHLYRAADLMTEAWAQQGIAYADAADALKKMSAALHSLGAPVEQGPDAYLARLGRDEPPTESTCPLMFTWSAFGAGYMDTQCDAGRLRDLDKDGPGDDPCPMCDPAGFFEWQFAGTYIVPTCLRCDEQLPTGTEIRYHEAGVALVYSADCPICEKRTWTAMRDYSDGPGARDAMAAIEATPSWEPAPTRRDQEVTA